MSEINELKKQIADYLVLQSRNRDLGAQLISHYQGARLAPDFARKLLVAISALEEINRTELSFQRPGGGYTPSAKLSYEALTQITAAKPGSGE